MVIDTVKSLSDETLKNVEGFSCDVIASVFETEKSIFVFDFAYKDGKFHGLEGIFTDEQYNSYENIVAINPSLRKYGGGIAVINIGDWDYPPIGGAESININGKDFKIIDTVSEYDFMSCPITAFYDNTPIRVQKDGWGFEITFKTDISRTQYDDIVNAVALNMGDNAEVPEMDISPTTELFYYRTVLMISVLISILAAINFAVLYRFVLQKRIKTLTIFRICGCTKKRIIFIYLCECMIIGLPLFALSMLLFDKIALPVLSEIFEYISLAYSPLLYSAIFGIYAVSSFAVLLIMIGTYISRHSITELKAGEL